MAETGSTSTQKNAPQPAEERVPFMQRVLDNPFPHCYRGLNGYREMNTDTDTPAFI